MTNRIVHGRVEQIPISMISVLNPRSRNRRQHRAIVENIRAIGLKRPITVCRRTAEDGVIHFELVCGQGRLEAYQLLNQKEIPAFVTDASQTESFVMSLVENVARRAHKPLELVREVSSLRKRGLTDPQIAERIGVTVAWVKMITKLLDRGEERLIIAVETGVLPISLATDIARCKDTDVQLMLADAYESGELSGRKLTIVRRILEQRENKNKRARLPPGATPAVKRKKLTATELRQIYQTAGENQRRLAMKAQLTHERLLFATEALKEILSDATLQSLLNAEGLTSIPKILSDRMSGLHHETA